MLFPKEAITTIEKTFYDKTVTKVEVSNALDAEGGLVKGEPKDGDSFLGNVRFNDLGVVVSELGLSESIDICITCPVSVAMELGGLFRYDDVVYQATNVVPSDSHLTITGKKWPAELASA